MTYIVKAPSPGAVFEVSSGNSYTADSNGIITGVVAGFDLRDLETAGCIQVNSNPAVVMNLLSVRNSDGSTLAAAASSGKFGAAISLGTSFALASESANNNTKTDIGLLEYYIPASYIAGTNLTVTVNASITGSGTLTTKTAQIKAYKTAANGTQSADISATGATAMTAAGADIAFTITGATLNPGDKLVLSLTTVLTETASSGMVANINSIRIS
jgi:hypothetical protein